MSALSKAKQEIIKSLKTALGKEYSPITNDLESPPDTALGDFAYPCFTLAKGLKKNPADIARELAAKVEPKGWIKKAEAKGPYVNFFLKSETFGKAVLEDIKSEGEKYGFAKDGRNTRVMVEYANPNTHKEVHVGHLRNFFVGQTAINLLQAVGHEVIPASYINDLGTHVAKCVWGLKKFYGDYDLKEEDATSFLGKVYTEATKAEEKNPKVKEEISKIFHELEAGKGESVALWKKTRKWSVNDLKKVFSELGLPIKVWYFESELIRPARKIIADLEKKGIAVKSQGALIVDLSEEGLGANLLVKSDGMLLYNAKDIPLAFRKEEEYHPEKSVYVIDTRQSLAMKQLFATLKRMGFKRELVHLSYDFVTLKEGVMSSRKGNIIRYETFRDIMIDSARKETKKRHSEWKDKKIEEVARAIAFAAMRFGMLRQDPNKKIIFDMAEALSFDGYTGPYLLYTYARSRSIIKKAGRLTAKIETKRLVLPIENQLLVKLAKYPETVSATAQDFKLDRLAEYLFDLAKTFATFYHDVPVTQAEDKETAAARLGLVEAVGTVLKNGLSMMGIETIEEM
ncbi:MAG: arginine--tRNA ligase [Patescibacteria group bacterium]|jgi:arginyl-tRNA synthetase